MIFTGIEGKKWFSVSYSLLKKEWKITEKKGKKIYVIPSDLCFVKKEIAEIKKEKELREYLKYEVEEYGKVLWDFKLVGDFYYLVLARDFNPPEDFFSLDCEIFSLARISRVLRKPNLVILDLGKRKTTFIEVKNYELDRYRVVLKGGNYLNERIQKDFRVSFDEAEKIKIEEGMSNSTVKKVIEEILSNIGAQFADKEVLLSGGLSKLKGLEDLFKSVLRIPYCEPELTSAFGASLKFVFKDNSPTFKKEEISPKEQKLLVVFVGLATTVFISYLLSKDFLKKEIMKTLNQQKKELFSAKFPDLPPVMVEEQLKNMKERKQSKFLELMYTVLKDLPEGVKIYRIEFKNSYLKLVGEAPESFIKNIKADSIRKTPEGNYEFEVVVR